MPHTIDQSHQPKEQFLLGKTAGLCWASADTDHLKVTTAADLAQFIRIHPYHDDWLSIGAQMLRVERDQLEQIRRFWHQVAGTHEPPNPFVAGFLAGAEEARQHKLS